MLGGRAVSKTTSLFSPEDGLPVDRPREALASAVAALALILEGLLCQMKWLHRPLWSGPALSAGKANLLPPHSSAAPGWLLALCCGLFSGHGGSSSPQLLALMWGAWFWHSPWSVLPIAGQAASVCVSLQRCCWVSLLLASSWIPQQAWGVITFQLLLW